LSRPVFRRFDSARLRDRQAPGKQASTVSGQWHGVHRRELEPYKSFRIPAAAVVAPNRGSARTRSRPPSMLALVTSRFTRSSTEPSWTTMRSHAHVHLRRGLARAAAQAHTTLGASTRTNPHQTRSYASTSDWCSTSAGRLLVAGADRALHLGVNREDVDQTSEGKDLQDALAGAHQLKDRSFGWTGWRWPTRTPSPVESRKSTPCRSATRW
jgi:hypothetical protein